MTVANMTSNVTSNNTSYGNSNSSNALCNESLIEEARRELMGINIYPFVFVIFYMIIGFTGNTIVIYIFTSKWKLTKTTIFILTLAGVDLMSCMVNMPTEAAILWNPLNFDYDVICKISRYMTFTATVSSTFVLVAISIDRYLMVCRPFFGRELGIQYAKRTCLTAVLLGLFLSWPSLIFYGTYTYDVEVEDSITNKLVKVEAKTCLISNFYVDHYKLPAGFYFFLFGGHIIMFIILTMVYLLIGRTLFMSTSTDLTDEQKHSLRYFGISMMSAFTGTVPNTPADNRERLSWYGKTSRSVSLENINRLDMKTLNDLARPQARQNNESSVSIVVNDIEKENKEEVKTENITNQRRRSLQLDDVCSESDKRSDKRSDDSLDMKRNNLCKQQTTFDTSANGTPFKTPKNEKNPNAKLLYLEIDNKNKIRDGRLSSGSTNSTNSCLTPMTPMSADSVRGILYRSQSIESRSRLNRIISDELTNAEVKEFILRRNTLIMRMVTIAFVVSFLPYLVIVTLRYSNTDIPTKLSKVEQIFYNVFLRTYFVNSMINPFIYGFMNTEFRAKIKQMFCAFCSRHNIAV
ncbi:uncharacterized protein LOC132727801 [Ruditapes philippinarum]|uniref:uncharacterized protein LOC132727801 n=1 Tax=Ruditapes philippinarum TaxID=129788 RepID=UPI00295BEC29|nr:uncharacterized protein LOC132727801 [Ruditapes philippinarum]XP_060569371.1 uncharacterized protein LOC132727801 [Ruditapes philippinarum]XP_060569372.1 uncharacterized protein LOC132727801 [Ruditapes philippinarum]XP_060569373.1 uncharacterized protein LOC132727801 [Ruditapes philippinarum]XP_060569374.1 uncharacterized protein LOC132727801 [Ruditapes philippinarum]